MYELIAILKQISLYFLLPFISLIPSSTSIQNVFQKDR